MKTNFGLWIDHRKAVIVDAANGDHVEVIHSNAERQPGRIDGKRSMEPFESLLVPADDVTDRKFEKQLNSYYDEVITYIHKAELLLIFGPGAAKAELKKRLMEERLSGRVIALETEDKLTDRQIAARVRQHFRAGSRDRFAAGPRRRRSFSGRGR